MEGDWVSVMVSVNFTGSTSFKTLATYLGTQVRNRVTWEHQVTHSFVRWNCCTGECSRREVPSIMPEDLVMYEDTEFSIPITSRGRGVRTSWSLMQDRTSPHLVKFSHIPSNQSFGIETDEVWVGIQSKCIIDNGQR
jgi:hypothetical protein